MHRSALVVCTALVASSSGLFQPAPAAAGPGLPRAAAGPGLPPGAAVPGLPPTPASCFDPAAFYEFGATDASAETGNSALTAVLDPAGSLTVLRSAAANDDNQVGFFASGYDRRTGRAIPQEPNQGAFLGIRYVAGGAPHFAWLRDWSHSQHYLSDDGAVVVTTFTAPAALGLSVTEVALATAGPLARLDAGLPSSGPDALVQDVTLQRSRSSPAADVELVAYGNWNPTAARVPYIPLADSGCTAGVNTAKRAFYDPEARAVVASWSGFDAAGSRPASSAVAFGWSSGTDSWQVGGDATDPFTPPTDPADAYEELSSSPYRLTGARSTVGQTTGAVMARPDLRSGTSASLQLVTTAAADRSTALSELAAARAAGYPAELSEAESSWARLLARAPAPRTTDARVLSVARRALVTALLAIDPDTGAIVASPDTQGPYGEDWVRDGSFIDAMLDENGYHDLVTRHDLFYARTQSSPQNPIPTTPPGDWPMVMYPSGGTVGGPIPYEIDETGYGAWALYRHRSSLPEPQGAQYLRSVFPAIARAADWLTACADPSNGFQCPANEDDNYAPSQTLHGALPTLLGLRSAVAAAGSLGVSIPAVAAWRSRAAMLASAIGTLYEPADHAYREGPGADPGSTLPVSFEDGGLMLWPAQLLSYGAPQMQGEADATWASMQSSFGATSGAYEAVALLGICRAETPPTPAVRARLAGALAQVMDTTTTPTGLFGEFWQRWGDGQVTPLNDMPHTWESALFDMSALCIYGN